MTSSRKTTENQDTTFGYVLGSLGVTFLVLLTLFSWQYQTSKKSDIRFAPYYSLESLGTNCRYLDQDCDQRLVYHISPNQKNVIVPNFTALFDSHWTHEELDYILEIYYQSPTSDRIFVEANTIGGPQYYSYDPNSKNIVLLNHYSTIFRSFASPDNRWTVSIGDNGKKLFYTDILTDQKKRASRA